MSVFLFSLKDRKEPVALEYRLNKSKYFPQVPINNLKKQFHCMSDVNVWNDQNMFVFGFWIGIFGTAPGIGTGSLILEARHSQWEVEISEKSKASVLNILPTIQTLYREYWDKIVQWDRIVSFSSTPTHYCDTLLNGVPLNQVGISNTKQFWEKNEQCQIT